MKGMNMENKFIITDDGIFKIIEKFNDNVDIEELIIPKEIFIKAYEKYIKDSDDLK